MKHVLMLAYAVSLGMSSMAHGAGGEAGASTVEPIRWRQIGRRAMAVTVQPAGPYLWAADHQSAWRIDRASGAVRMYDQFAGLTFQSPPSNTPTVSRDGKFALRYRHRVYHVDQQGRLSRLSSPHASEAFRIAFGPDSKLYLLAWTTKRIYVLNGAEWQKVRDVPQCHDFMPTAKGFVLSSVEGSRWSGFIPKAGGAFKPTEHPRLRSLNVHFPVFFAGGRMMGRFRGVGNGSFGYVEDGRIKLATIGTDLLFDVRTGKPLTLEDDRVELPNGEWGHHLVIEGEGKIAIGSRFQQPVWYFGDGEVWASTARWDAKKVEWTWHPTRGRLTRPDLVHDPRFYRWDAASGEPVWIESPLDFRARMSLDPKTGTYWEKRTRNSRPNEEQGAVVVLEQFELVDGEPRLTRRVEHPNNSGWWLTTPDVMDRHGNWWAGARHRKAGKFAMVRINRKGQLAFYPAGRGQGASRPTYRIDSNRMLWVWQGGSTWRYDADRDALVDGDPLGDASFEFGQWTLSFGGKPVDDYGQRTLYRKTGEGWKPLTPTFDGKPGTGTVATSPEAFRGDRMLVGHSRYGTLEYDATRDRWIVLHPSEHYAKFVETGDRLLVGRTTLLLQGDPFGGLAAAARGHVAELSASDPSMRRAAERGLIHLHQYVADQLATIRNDPNTPKQRRERLAAIAEAGREAEPGSRAVEMAPTTSLFEMMYPPVPRRGALLGESE